MELVLPLAARPRCGRKRAKGAMLHQLGLAAQELGRAHLVIEAKNLKVNLALSFWAFLMLPSLSTSGLPATTVQGSAPGGGVQGMGGRRRQG